ncbi:U-box domain-containing protein 6 [Ricinus communis]|uniref:Ubiquitin-protein ligase, putative n=1 Tax=Ricinus communis TaxID=3988 RepID=B9S654_RICCO|nr:U-box domain-containing protein 6 [Ricinus communis]EEF40963.1 ubiquitin-protein ligase, putative [Ricinus communis]|eukprot:XP_002521473.1 U-box domain-containing protein 6 [Ricinus communis]
MEEFVVHNLFSGGREAQIQAANDLGKFSSKQRHKLVERGIISPLVAMLQSQDCEAIEAALFALLSLAFGSERNKIRIVKSGVVPVLLELLDCPNETLLELVIAALLILSSCAPNKLAITSLGAIPLIIGVLNQDYADDDAATSCISMQAKLDAIATLHNLSTCQQIIPSIVSSGTVFILLQIIHSYEKSSQLVEKAMALLENIITLSETALLQTATTGGAIRALVENIEEGSPQCKEHAVVILLLICQSCRDKYRGLILREGVMPGLLQLSVDGTWRAKDTAQELLLLLRDYSGYGTRGKQSKHELVEQIMQEIDAEGETIRETTTLRLVEEMIAKLNT